MERAIYSDPKTVNDSPLIEIDVIDNNFAPNIMKQKVNLLKKKILYERNSS